MSNTPPSGCWLIDLFYCQNDDDFIRTIEKVLPFNEIKFGCLQHIFEKVDLLKIFIKFTGNSRKKNLHNL